jgi:hypothetical protein
MSSAEIYRGWIIEARPVFCVQVWSAAGECVIPIHNAKTEEEALHFAKTLDRSANDTRQR